MRSMDRKNRIKTFCGVSVRTVSVRLLVMFLVAALLCGCKPSPVLQKLVYAESEVPENTVEEPDDSETQEDDPVDDAEADKSESEDSSEGDVDPDREADNDSGEDGSASGDDDTGKESEGDGANDGSEQGDSGDGDQDHDGESSDSEGDSDGSLMGESDRNSGEVTELTDDLDGRLVVDADGVEVPVPQNIKTIAAVGPAATMVEMLAGEGVLLATDRELLANPLCRRMFSDIDSIEGLWPDAHVLMDDESFERLLDLKPDLCLEISGRRNFTSDQVLRLKESGIAYFVLPALSSIYGLKVSVVKLGEILGAERKAKEYCNYVDDIVDDMKDATEGLSYSTLYIADWVDAEYELTGAEGLPLASGLVSEGGKQKGSGMAVAWSSAKDNLLNDFLGVCNITNESTAHKKKYNDSEYIYISPLISQFSPKFYEGRDAMFYKKIAPGYDRFLAVKEDDGGLRLLGSERYPCILVSSTEVMEKLDESWFWSCFTVENIPYEAKHSGKDGAEKTTGDGSPEGLGGLGAGKIFGAGKTDSGQINEGIGTQEAGWAGSERVRPGTLESCTVSFGGKTFYSSICGSYTIIVNPYGTGDWAEGCVESPLEALCAASMIMGVYSQLDALFAAKNFYMKFFDYDISQEEIVDILSATYRPKKP